MIRSALMYKTVFPRLKHKDSHYKNVPTEDDWVLAKEISDKFDVFYQATEEFSGTKYPTANNYLPTVCDIRDAINDWSTSIFEQIKLMASSMAHKFDSYWGNFHGIMVVATILDPRYKMKVMECYFHSFYGDGSSYEINKIQQVLLRMVGEYEKKSKASQASSIPCTTIHVKTKLGYYLEETVIPRVENFDILTWWKVNASKYPTLHCIARDILAIPVSKVASESAFSTGGRFVSPHRSRLHPKTVEALLCAHSWLWSEFNGINNPFVKNLIDGMKLWKLEVWSNGGNEERMSLIH
ncbi:hypothetical protein Ddye_012528 [Dipteronia dyeriana]|uniref:Transposase n=1 Tax=Dipteronia dyeriana TaxID=168575 RepID=A0AAD9X4R5_9ROSI|nr:hypothetical protein Ddye_012528 [Dipteronia dyeriana]